MTWITTPDIPAETWRRLLELANPDIALTEIVKRHGDAKDKSTEQNYRKQALQIRASILQAREYFDAAESSSLITSPNHLYYGMVSLGSAIMLMLGDGRKALDRLRTNRSNNNHGLDFTTSISAGTCSDKLKILENSSVAIRGNGFFRNWYEVLPRKTTVFGIHRITDGGSVITNRRPLGSEHTTPFDQLVNSKYTVFDLVKYLPDLTMNLLRYGVDTPKSRVTFRAEERVVNTGKQVEYTWSVHGVAKKEHLSQIVKGFITPEGQANVFDIKYSASELSCRISISQPQDAEGFTFNYPAIRECLDNSSILYDREINRDELVDSYLSAFGLSMLSRYFPDVWVRCIDSHCMASKLIEQLVFVLLQKAPLLCLKILSSEEDIVISNHRPTWYS